MTANNQHQPRRRGRGRPFLPGQSGNPSGRPRVEGEIRELARSRGTEAIATLVTLMRTGIDKIRLEAAQALLDRGYGRAPQSIAGPLVNIDLRTGDRPPLPSDLTPTEAFLLLQKQPERADEYLAIIRGKRPAQAAAALIEHEPVAEVVRGEIASPARHGEAGERDEGSE